jgi:hypothetical protein
MEGLTPEVLGLARTIVERSNFWTSDIEKLLRRWRKQINGLHLKHKDAERKYNKLYYLLGVPTTILSTVVSSGILTTFQNCNICTTECSPDANSTCASDAYIRLAMGIIGVLSVVLTVTMIFLNYGAASSDNKTASDEYGELAREIDAIVEAPPITRGDAIVSLHQIRTKFDDIVKKSPSLESSVSLEYRTFKTEKPNGVTRTKTKMPDASSLAKILVDTIEEENENDALKRQKIDETNDHNTDEDQEVAIGIDLEAMRPGDTKRTAMEESLTRALQFELSRFYVPDERKIGRRKKKKSSEVIDIGPIGNSQGSPQSSPYSSHNPHSPHDKDKGDL